MPLFSPLYTEPYAPLPMISCFSKIGPSIPRLLPFVKLRSFRQGMPGSSLLADDDDRVGESRDTPAILRYSSLPVLRGLSRETLLELMEDVRTDTNFAHHLGHTFSLGEPSETGSSAPSKVSHGDSKNLESLVEELLLQSFNTAKSSHTSTSSHSRQDWYGPSPQQRSAHLGFSSLSSLFALRQGQSGTDKPLGTATTDTTCTQQTQRPSRPTTHDRDAFLDFASTMRQRRLPPGRLTVAANLLYLTRTSTARKPGSRRESDLLKWLWQEWTLLRENDPAGPQDEIILVGFLDAVSALPEREETLASDDAGQPPSQESRLADWQKQVLAMALRDVALQPSTLWRGGVNSPYQDPPSQIHPRLLRSLASACLRAGRWDLTLDCLYDTRLRTSDVIPVLQQLSAFLLGRDDLEVSTRQTILSIISRIFLQLPISTSRTRLRQTTDIVCALVRHRRIREAEAYMDNLPTSSLCELHLSKLVRELLAHRQHGSILRLYQRLPTAARQRLPLTDLIASHSKALSDAVWDYVTRQTGAPDKIDDYLISRLLYHRRHQQPNTRQARREFDAVVKKFALTPHAGTYKLLLYILLRGGLHTDAQELYDRHKDRWSEHERRQVHNMLLSTVNVPHKNDYRHKGAEGWTNTVNREYVKLATAEGMQPDGVTANILLKATLGWVETDREAIWAALHAGLKEKDRDWDREIKPLYHMIIKAFLRKGLKEDVREVVIMKARDRDARKRTKQDQEQQWGPPDSVKIRT